MTDPEELFRFLSDAAARATVEDLARGSTDPKVLVQADSILDGWCQHCRITGRLNVPGRIHRQSTQYEHQLSNYVCLCAPCTKENDAYWEEMWKEYYSGLI